MSNSEEMLTAIVNGEQITDTPTCRKEQFLKAIANNEGTTDLPEPNCREEKLLLQIAEKGLGGEKPTGEIEITENGLYSVVDYASAKVNVQSGVGVGGEFVCRVIDYNGTNLKGQELNAGDVFELPEPPTHDKLVFQEWACAVDIVNNGVVVENQDILVGPVYTTKSGLSEFDIELSGWNAPNIETDGFVVTFNMVGTKDWGDGTSDDLTTHTYTSYGKYTITCDGTALKSWMFGQNGESTANKYLVEVRLGNSISTIADDTFGYCWALKNLTIPNTVTKLGARIVSNSHESQTIIIPNSVTTGNNYCFANTTGLKNFIGGRNIYSLYSVFAAGSQIEYITLRKDSTNASYFMDSALSTPRYLKSITIFGNPGGYKYVQKYFCSNATSLKKVRFIDDGTTQFSVRDYAFQKCYILEEIEFPTQCNLFQHVLEEAINLKKVTLPPNLISIPEHFCAECPRLAYLKFPSTLTKIGNYAFYAYYYKDVVNKVYDFRECTQVPTLGGTSAFNNIGSTSKIVVPDNLYDEWIVATNWATYANYIYKASEVQL